MQREEPAKPFIEWLGTNCNISDASLAECVERLGPARIYTIYCGKRAFSDCRSWMRNSIHFQSNPFSPQVNICVEPMAEPDEWVMEANGRRIGSKGIH